MKLSIPPLGQRDGRWNRKILGSSGSIGNYGCLLVCHTMMLNYYGKDFTPDTLNAVYKEKKVYFKGNLIGFTQAADVFPDISADERIDCKPTCDLGKIDKYLREKKPVIAWVDNVENDKKPDHFVLIIGKTDDGKYITNDPWTGETYFFDAKWGDPAKDIYGLRLYSGTPPNGGKSLEDEVGELRQSLYDTNKALGDKAWECGELQGDVQKAQVDAGAAKKELLKVRGERDKAVWDWEQLVIKKEKDDGGIIDLKEKVGKQKDKIDELQKQKLSVLDNSKVYKEAIRRILIWFRLKRGD